MTGIPNPQEDHAVIMVKFARDCMYKFNQVKHELADSLGEDTSELEMRIGLHSGPTTGGVLRGEKGRFQLFVSNTEQIIGWTLEIVRLTHRLLLSYLLG